MSDPIETDVYGDQPRVVLPALRAWKVQARDAEGNPTTFTCTGHLLNFPQPDVLLIIEMELRPPNLISQHVRHAFHGWEHLEEVGVVSVAASHVQ